MTSWLQQEDPSRTVQRCSDNKHQISTITSEVMNEVTLDPPFNCLPPEIISCIFLPCHEVWKSQDPLPFQVTLSQVCRYWRQIALSTSQLWSSITLFSEDSLPCVQEWLKRSCSSPLSVRLDLLDRDRGEDLPPYWYDEVLGQIVSNVHRFHTLLIFTFRETTVYHILRLFEYSGAPLLENIFVANVARIQRRAMAPFSLAKHHFSLSSTFKGGLPKLAFAQFQPLRCIPPLATITTLHISGLGFAFNLYLERLVEILRLPHQLITLSIEGSVHYLKWPEPDGRPRAYLPHLQNLELSSPDETCFRILVFLNAPKVKSLRWVVDDWSGYCSQFRSVKPLLRENPEVLNFPSLRYLTLVDVMLDSWHLRTLMELFPNPTYVLFHRPGYSNTGALQFLQQSDEFDWGWKQLEVLAFKAVGSETVKGRSKDFVYGLGGLIAMCPRIRKVMVDTELLQHLKADVVDIEARIGVCQLEYDGFPDYWWNVKHDWKDTPNFIEHLWPF